MVDLGTARAAGASRRGFLQAGSLLLGGLSLGDLGRLRAVSQASRSSETSVILLWLEGGPSQLETFDLKPNAPAEVRGEFRPIRTRIPGLEICEHLPLLARIADRFSLIRSISHRIPDHPGAAARFLTGYVPTNISDPIAKYPTFEAVTAHCRSGRNAVLPAHISNVARVKGGGSAYLGNSGAPFVVSGDPNSPDFHVDCLDLDNSLASRLDDRRALSSALDGWQRRVEAGSALPAQDSFRQRAFRMLTSGPARDAFDLSREPSRVRERYGRHEWGQRVLMARRLVEAGCSFVTVQLTSPRGPSPLESWDDHGDVGHIFKNNRVRLPLLDRCASALIEDLAARGLDQRVLVIVAGEFGRTPLVNMGRGAKPKFPGRDHWPSAMSVLVAGGGWRMGQVIGSTDSHAGHPRERALEPNDFLASVYHFLGIDPNRMLPDTQGRPIAILPSGRVIPELIGSSANR